MLLFREVNWFVWTRIGSEVVAEYERFALFELILELEVVVRADELLEELLLTDLLVDGCRTVVVLVELLRLGKTELLDLA